MVFAAIHMLKTFKEWLAKQEGLLHTFSKFVLPVSVAAIALYGFYFMPLAIAQPLDLDSYIRHMWVHAWQDLPSKPTSSSISASGATS
jgi:dolichyl-phosphate-mannose--protein O-mannosyl transferase